MKRYAILVSAVLMQLCLGATYSWSIYVSPIRELCGLGQGVTQLPFSLFYFTFPAMMAVTGSWLLPRIGPRRCAIFGGLLFGAGWLLAGLGENAFLITILGIGLLAGIGAGMAYIIPLTIGMGWFPENKGLVTGVAVAGFGGGAALVSLIGNRLIEIHQLSPFQSLSVFGGIFLLLIPAAGSQMAYAPGRKGADVNRSLPGGILTTDRFQYLYLAMFAGLAAGFGFNANIRELYTGNQITTGVLAVSLFALANAAGRITWGWIADRWRVASAITFNLIFQGLVMLSVILVSGSTPGFLLLSLLAGFNYGGVLVLYAAAVEHEWGEGQVAGIYSLLFSANIPAAAAPVLAGWGFDYFGNFNLSLLLFLMLLFSAAILQHRNHKQIRR